MWKRIKAQDIVLTGFHRDPFISFNGESPYQTCDSPIKEEGDPVWEAYEKESYNKCEGKKPEPERRASGFMALHLSLWRAPMNPEGTSLGLR
jgi:hypothetical protein